MRRWRRLLLHHVIFHPISRYMQRQDKKKFLQTLPAQSEYLRDVIEYNLSVGEHKYTRTMRAVPLYRLADARPNDHVLIIGPRDVHELLIAWCCGFTWTRIHGLDLYSRNPKIIVADAADTALLSDAFNVIISSASFSYFHDPDVVLDEMVRILAPGGRLIFNASHSPGSQWVGNGISDWRPLLEKRGLIVYHYDAYMKRKDATISTYGATKA